MSDVITIGIAGGTGSGKTTITRRILDEFGGDVSVLYHDNYYKRHDDIPFAERKKLNYDHPNAFDTPLLVQHLDALRAGQAVACPTYDYTVHNRAAETITVTPAKVIVVEGILIFAEPELRDRLDIKLFVDTDADVRILRRIVRDVRDRGRDLTCATAAAIWSRSSRSISRRSSPCTRCSSSRRSAMPTSLSPKAGIIRLRSILSWSVSGPM